MPRPPRPRGQFRRESDFSSEEIARAKAETREQMWPLSEEDRKRLVGPPQYGRSNRTAGLHQPPSKEEKRLRSKADMAKDDPTLDRLAEWRSSDDPALRDKAEQILSANPSLRIGLAHHLEYQAAADALEEGEEQE